MRKRPSLLVVTILALTLGGCCPAQVAYVPVREARFRSEATKQERIQLPLTAESRERVVRFLRAGGDTDRLDEDIADPEVEARYAPLLDLLADPRNLTLADLTEKETYRAWFRGPVIRQVIDAREEAPPAIDPVAVIGHTHHARIAIRETKTGELFTLIDCGAWIENCLAEGDASPMPNAQIAALSANEARIYQLQPI